MNKKTLLTVDVKIKDFDEVKKTLENQQKIIESQARIIEDMVTDAEEIKKLLLSANEAYTNNKDFEVNLNVLKALEILEMVEVGEDH